jgi:Tfp pilus assembly protein PilV
MHKRGFTFLEILFMVVVMSVGLIAIMKWVPIAIETKVKTEQRTRAIFLAQGKMEETKRRVLSSFTNFSENWSVGNFYGTTLVSNDTYSNLKILQVSAWHIDRPNDITTFYTKVALR